MQRFTAVLALLILSALAIAQPQTLSPASTPAQVAPPAAYRQRVFSDAYGGIYGRVAGPQGRRVAVAHAEYPSAKPDMPARFAVGTDVALGIMQPEEIAEVQPPQSLADQLVALLNKYELDGMAFISRVGFGGDAASRWKDALIEAGMPDDAIEPVLVLVDSLVKKAENDARMLTSKPVAKPAPVTPTIKATPAKAASSTATPLPAPVKPTVTISAEEAVLPTTTTAPIGWSAAETITPENVRAGDIVFVYSPYQFVIYQDPMNVSSPLPEPPTFWRMGVVVRVEADRKRFGLSMDYVQSRNMRTVWTVVNFSECLEIKRFGNVPYQVK